MNRKLIFVFLCLNITYGLFAQQIEKLTFTDRRSDGTIVGSVTVNAIHAGWSLQEVSLENNLQVIYESFNLTGEWSDWQLVGKSPAPVSTILQLYNIVLGEYNRYPRSSVRVNIGNGLQAVRIASIPKGRSSPMWWNDDGRSFFTFYEFWTIVP